MRTELIFANSTNNSDLLYVTGFSAPDDFLYFSVNREKYLVANVLEYDRAKSQAKAGIKVLLLDDILDKSYSGYESILSGVVKNYNLKSVSIPGSVASVYSDFLREIGVKVIIEKGDFYPERLVKTEEELDLMRESCAITVKGMERARDIFAESTIGKDNILIWNEEVLTSEIVQTEINIELLRHGAIGSDTIAASGVQGSQPHNHGHGPISANVPIVVDIFPRMLKNGYWGDMTRTFVKGKAEDVVKKAYEAVKKSKHNSKEATKTGANPKELYQIAMNTLVECGFETGKKGDASYGFIHGLGHGLGLDIHEQLRINPTNEEPLKTNNIVTIEPGLYYGEWGGIRLEDSVIVKENGVETLTPFEEVLEIA